MVVAGGAILIVALVLFVGRSFDISREHFEQVRITEDARIQIDRVSNAIRNAQYVDCDGDGRTDGLNEHWLKVAEDDDLEIYADIDGDGATELVRFYVEVGTLTELKRQVVPEGAEACDFSAAGETQVLMRTLRNNEQAEAVFSYFSGSDKVELGTPVTALTSVDRLGIRFFVDVTEDQYPPAAEVATEVTVRSAPCSSDAC